MCHPRRNYADFTEALRNDVVYLGNGRVHASGMGRMLELNIGRGGIKRLMKEVAARHVEAIHYSASTSIFVASGTRDLLRKEAEERRSRPRRKSSMRWHQIEENTVFIEAAYEIYEVLVDDKRAGKAGGAGPSGWYDTWSGPKSNDVSPARSQERENSKVLSFWLSSKIKKKMDLRNVLEEESPTKGC